jgi:hypothetical protein
MRQLSRQRVEQKEGTMNVHVRFAGELDSGEGFFAHEDGYVITPKAQLLVGEMALPTGEQLIDEGLPIVDGGFPIPMKVRRVRPTGYLIDEGSPMVNGGFPIPMKVRRLRPTGRDWLYIVDRDRFARLTAYPEHNIVKMATDIGDGDVLIGTEHELHEVRWGGRVVECRFVQAAYEAEPVNV